MAHAHDKNRLELLKLYFKFLLLSCVNVAGPGLIHTPPAGTLTVFLLTLSSILHLDMMRAASALSVQQAPHPVASRRGLLLGAVAMPAFFIASPFDSAHAFGNGFPGYDVNLDGRKRALERNKREMEADKKRAAEFRAKRDAAKEQK